MTRLDATLAQFERAVLRLREVLSLEKNEVIRDSAIKRFELTLDLSWKLIKVFLREEKGLMCTSPKDCFRQAYAQGVIEYEESYLRLVDMRNETVHIYNEEIAQKIYSELHDALAHFETLLTCVREQVND